MNFQERWPQPSSLKQALLARLVLGLGVSQEQASLRDWFQATALTVRELLTARWHETNRQVRDHGLKQVSYLSMEFLLGRGLQNGLMALNILDECREALAECGVRLEDLIELEVTPALGNGGLGRLAACFLDSMASLGLPSIGYGIRYEFGMFRQEVIDGWQIERPDDWLADSNPWEFMRPERQYLVRFGGRVVHEGNRVHWLDGEAVYAIAYDTLVPGHGHYAVNTLRLWGARPVEPMDLATFNRGAFMEALSPQLRARTVVRVLYPDDSTIEGRELRLRQEHFFVSASIQDTLRRFRADYDDWALLPDKISIHLNDTHPALAPAELMRQLVDEHLLAWDDAWDLVTRVLSYTNHTLMPEALEIWPCDMMGRLLPRHLQIIEEINRRFGQQVEARPGDNQPDLFAKVSVIQEDGERRVNMGRLSVLSSHKVNGVSRLHSRLVRERLFPEFAELFPERFANVTNGITPRLWLNLANPKLATLINETIGDGWQRDLSRLADLRPSAEDDAFCGRLADIKALNKQRLAKLIAHRVGIEVNPAAMFDVQVKRIHEYKRQLLNLLHVIARWNAMRAAPEQDWPARVVIMAGKAASAYHMAKLIIKLAHDIGRRINNDPVTGDRLKLVFLPDYSVSLAEYIIPAADLSEQISLAGTEASGTGNMKLALNGALTIGTADGANVEIAEQVGPEDIFIFGMSVEEVAALDASGTYSSREIYRNSQQLQEVIDQLGAGQFSSDPACFWPIVDSLLDGNDHFKLLADFDSYWQAQRAVDRAWRDQPAWLRKAARNIAGAGRFSSDRSIRDYASRIWNAGYLPA
ncbi:glycogen/starch/alpha-glucan phosphorylase [Rhodoligotrophos defluvii]|uniref:glycogen/starch/alpha-glucan phosphorylase n=1 Tax=Rhodoligotrophos defluvii TaxID=2561934 RepID=UPI0010C9C702|nr:glycogen/starch/alpha-glucan phosphorylase [Rhodoligotrophos defluvii]